MVGGSRGHIQRGNPIGDFSVMLSVELDFVIRDLREIEGVNTAYAFARN